MIRDCSKDIAVIGISARFPGPSEIDKWWEALLSGQILTKRYKLDELLESGVSQRLIDDPDYVPVYGHLVDADHFDNKLFRVSPRDAEMMDPQHRLMLEVAWAALEDAGYADPTSRPITGVFASGSGSGYMRAMIASGMLDHDSLEQGLHGTEPDFIASLIAYKLDLRGPAIAVQTACSSSLVAIHLARQALLNGECEQALVIASGMNFPQAGHLHIPGGIKSKSGECRPFDQNADGIIEGAGVACVVLKRLSDVLPSDPELYGIIIGTAINNDGARKAGYFAPSIDGQISVIHEAICAAGIDASSIGYLETHGTGTNIGDPIEWAAASEAYKKLGATPGQIAVGALKANIGHLDAAAGLASLIKAMFVVKSGEIPPLAGFESVNPLLDVIEAPLFIPKKKKLWNSQEVRHAGVSAFGIGGTNAHIIIEQPKSSLAQESSINDNNCPKLIVISAIDTNVLRRLAQLLREYLLKQPHELLNITFTLANGRAALPERLAIVGSTSQEIVETIAENYDQIRGRVLSDLGPIIFSFPGQGSQFPGMGLAFSVLPGFSENIENCLSAFAFDSEISNLIRQSLFEKTFLKSNIDDTSLAQPSLFVLEYAIAKSLMQIGITPSALVGHSLGEITAMCLAGVLKLSDAARFIVTRGKAMSNCTAGAMLAVGCEQQKLEELLTRSKLNLYITAVNTLESCVVGGKIEDVRAFQSFLGDSVFSRLLNTNLAFHTPLIQTAIHDIKAVLENIKLYPAQIPIAMNVNGKILSAGSNLNTDYFLQHAEQPVKFANDLTTLQEKFPDGILIEVGLGKALSSMAMSMNWNSISFLPDPSETSGVSILKGLGKLWAAGYPIKISNLCKKGKKIHLPTYPFQGPKWMAPEAIAGLRGKEKLQERDVSVSKNENNTNFLVSSEQKSSQDVSEILTRFWKELLKHESIVDESDFFDLGGDSLLMTSLVRKLTNYFNVQVPPRLIFSTRTLGEQITIIRELLRDQGV